MAPAIKPSSKAEAGLTKPEAGVIATKPATAPEIAPSIEGFFVLDHSAAIHPSAPLAAAKCVATNALVASAPDETALPALKPNQPTQSRHAPMKLRTKLWGGDWIDG